MDSHILNKFGFKTLTIKQPSIVKKELAKKKISTLVSTISVVKPLDHANPQFVVKLSRDILTQLKWEISDRVVIMANLNKQTIALIKTNKKEKNSFAISTQGSSIQVAKETKRGGIVKIGWREDLSYEAPSNGTYDINMELFQDALIMKLPDIMFITEQKAA